MRRSDGGLRKLFRQHLPAVHWTTIESRYTESGIPDTNGCHQSTEFWVEFKKARGREVSLRPTQIAWILRRCRAGGRALVAVRRRGRSVDELWLIDGRFSREARDGGLTLLPRGALLGQWDGGPARWCWPAVLAALAGRGRPKPARNPA